MKINKNVITVFILLSIFVTGLAIAEPVTSAKYVKFDSGSFPLKEEATGFKKNAKYVSYSKKNKIHINMYITFKASNKNFRISQTQFTKSSKNYIKQSTKSFGSTTQTKTFKYTKSLSTYYKLFIKGMKETK